MAPDAGTFLARFEEDYTKLFGRPVAGLDVEITVWSVNATTPPEPVDRVVVSTGGRAAKLNGSRKVFDVAAGGFVDAQVYQREDLAAGDQAAGPAAVVEAETTIIVPASRNAVRQPDGCIDLILKQ